MPIASHSGHGQSRNGTQLQNVPTHTTRGTTIFLAGVSEVRVVFVPRIGLIRQDHREFSKFAQFPHIAAAITKKVPRQKDLDPEREAEMEAFLSMLEKMEKVAALEQSSPRWDS